MASLENKYLVEENDRESREKRNSFTALIYVFRADLLPMLMATENRIDRLPVMYMAEANA